MILCVYVELLRTLYKLLPNSTRHSTPCICPYMNILYIHTTTYLHKYCGSTLAQLPSYYYHSPLCDHFICAKYGNRFTGSQY